MTPGYTFTATEVVTNAKLASLVSNAQLETDEVITANLTNLCVTTPKIADQAVTNEKIKQFDVDADRLTKGTAGQILVASATGEFVAVDVSGDAAMGDDGALTLADGSVDEDALADEAVSEDKLATGAVTPTKIALLVYDTSSVANAFSANLAGLTELTPGLEIRLKTQLTVTGASTLNLNGLGASPVYKPGGLPISNSDIPGGSVCALIWDGAAWQLVSPPMGWLARVEVRATHISIPTINPTNFSFMRVRAYGAGGSAGGSAGASVALCYTGAGGGYAECVYPSGYTVPPGWTMKIAVAQRHTRAYGATDAVYRTGLYLEEDANPANVTWLAYAATGQNSAYYAAGQGGVGGGTGTNLSTASGGPGIYGHVAGQTAPVTPVAPGSAGQGIGFGADANLSIVSGTGNFDPGDGDHGLVILEYIES